MLLLVLGLVLFLGVHSTRIVADGWRSGMVARLGAGPWKGLYTVIAIAGFAALVWGYGLARHNPVVLWAAPPRWVRHVAALLTLVAFVLLAAAYVPRNQIRAKVHHPMVAGTKVWAFAHLVANNTLADVLLFGGFLLWAVLDFRSARKRDAGAGTVYPPGTAAMTAVTVAGGVVAWAVFAFWLHAAWIGVAPMGR